MTARFRAVIAAVAALGVAVGISWESAAATTNHGCHLRRATVVKSTREAVIFRRKDVRVFGGVLYGCYRRKGAIYRLNSRNLDGVPSPVKLRAMAGRYVGYLDVDEGVTGSDDLTSVAVRDLVTGVVINTVGAGNDEGGSTRDVSSFVLNHQGLAAWIAKHSIDDRSSQAWEYQLLVMGRTGDRRVLDRGQDIEPRSLILSRDGRTLSWRKAGVLRTAAFD